jgi:hypothetical protein
MRRRASTEDLLVPPLRVTSSCFWLAVSPGAVLTRTVVGPAGATAAFAVVVVDEEVEVIDEEVEVVDEEVEVVDEEVVLDDGTVVREVDDVVT